MLIPRRGQKRNRWETEELNVEMWPGSFIALDLLIGKPYGKKTF